LPVVGIKVARSYLGEVHEHLYATTDAQGRFRLVGGPKRPTYEISVGGKPGVPYFGLTRHSIADTPGLEPVKADFEVERGLEIKGKVLDKVSGRPVRGRVMYFRTRDNPFAANYTTLNGLLFDISRWGEIGPDGSFSVLGIPGPGALVVLAKDSALYPRIDSQTLLPKMGVSSFPVDPAHLAVKIDPREDRPASRNCGTLMLTPGGKRTGTLTDAAGQPLIRVRVVGLSDSESPQSLGGTTFTATGLHPKVERALVFLHRDRKLGAVVGLAAGNAFTVKLQPLAAIKGRLLDGNGKALGNQSVVVRLVLDDKRYCNLPQEYDGFQGGSFHHGSWSGFTGRETTTDREGRFRIEGIIPGATYNLFAGPGDIERKGGVTHLAKGLTLSPSQEKDLGDLKPTDPLKP
jgi:hypothetical protein